MNPLRVLCVEDSVLFRRRPMGVFSWHKGFRVAVCSSRRLVDGRARIPRGGVVVIDALTWAAGARALVDTVQRISAIAPVVLLEGQEHLRGHSELIRAGKVSLVTHAVSERFLLGAVKAAAKGEMWLEEGLLVKVVTELLGAKEYRGKRPPTGREQEVLEQVAGGKTNKEIAAALRCSLRTVKGHVAVLFHKTGVSNRSGLTNYAVRKELGPRSAGSQELP